MLMVLEIRSIMGLGYKPYIKMEYQNKKLVKYLLKHEIIIKAIK
jgi:hypothetical protein